MLTSDHLLLPQRLWLHTTETLLESTFPLIGNEFPTQINARVVVLIFFDADFLTGQMYCHNISTILNNTVNMMFAHSFKNKNTAFEFASVYATCANFIWNLSWAISEMNDFVHQRLVPSFFLIRIIRAAVRCPNTKWNPEEVLEKGQITRQGCTYLSYFYTHACTKINDLTKWQHQIMLHNHIMIVIFIFLTKVYGPMQRL